MGKANFAVNRLLERKVIFADLMNGALHGGKQVLKPEELEVISPHAGIFLRDDEGKEKTLERVGDIRMAAENRSYAVIFAEETQAGVHYGMPIRTMLNAVLEYLKQIQDIEKGHREQGDKLQGAELLSGMMRNDKLKAVVNVVFYLGDDWDGSRSLYDMLDMDWDNPEAKELQKYIPDFPITLICAKDIEHPENYRTCLQHIFRMLRYNRDKGKLYDYVITHRDELNRMDYVENMAAMVLLGMQKKVEMLMEQNVEEREISVCKAIEDLIKDGEARGEVRGEARGEARGKELGQILGENRFMELTRVLLDANRVDDLKRATEDMAYRKRLYEEYGIA